MGAYLKCMYVQMYVYKHRYFHGFITCSLSNISYLPHYYGNQPHDGFIETVKEVSQRLPLFPHVPNDQTEAHGEHYQAQSVDSIYRTRHWDHLLPCDPLAPVDCKYRLIHSHLNADHSLGILGPKLYLKKIK